MMQKKSSITKRVCYPDLDFIGYGRKSINDSNIDSVVVLKLSHLTQGVKIAEFEKALCKYTGAKYAVVVFSGTAALHIACLAAGLKEKDEFITSPNTFVASANCGVYCGAKPIFADIKEDIYNIDPKEIKNIVQQKQAQYQKKIFIIEDSSHALGYEYKGSKAGSCAYSDMTVMSFHPVKYIITGEGEVVFTNDEKLYQKLKLLGSHGITHDKEGSIFKEQSHDQGGKNPWYYEQPPLVLTTELPIFNARWAYYN